VSYIGLGSRVASQQNGLVAADNTGNNPGNWTVTFSPKDINVNVPYFEIHKIVIDGLIGSSFTVYIDQNLWDHVAQGWQNSWDPKNPMLLIPGRYLYFYWSDPATDGHPPTVTLWLRYDPGIPSNMGMGPQ
jgi:hypothetical protein